MLDRLKRKFEEMDGNILADNDPVSVQTYEADAVYGINRDLPLNYVERSKVDPTFQETLRRNKHVIVYGSSKQGKTSLRKKWLADDDYIVVSCLNTMNLSDLHGAILKAAGYRIEQSVAKTVGGHYKFNAEFKGKGKVPLVAEAEATAGADVAREHSDTVTSKRLEVDLQDVNDIVAALREVHFNQHITLEDFHYLPVETQKAFAFALKSFHENSDISFIVIGVWREKNRIIYYNGDLTGRVVSIDADEWTRPELEDVIGAGERLLNITFEPGFRAGLWTAALMRSIWCRRRASEPATPQGCSTRARSRLWSVRGLMHGR